MINCRIRRRRQLHFWERTALEFVPHGQDDELYTITIFFYATGNTSMLVSPRVFFLLLLNNYVLWTCERYTRLSSRPSWYPLFWIKACITIFLRLWFFLMLRRVIVTRRFTYYWFHLEHCAGMLATSPCPHDTPSRWVKTRFHYFLPYFSTAAELNIDPLGEPCFVRQN